MCDETSSTIPFDVLLRGETEDISVAAADLNKLRPPAEAIERCFRWLSEQGVTCHRTDFGLACEAKVALFESLFDVKVTKQQAGATSPACYRLSGQPKTPAEIGSLVSQVTVAQPPTFFS